MPNIVFNCSQNNKPILQIITDEKQSSCNLYIYKIESMSVCLSVCIFPNKRILEHKLFQVNHLIEKNLWDRGWYSLWQIHPNLEHAFQKLYTLMELHPSKMTDILCLFYASTSNGSTKRLKKYYFTLHLEKTFGEKNELMLTFWQKGTAKTTMTNKKATNCCAYEWFSF